MMKNVFTPALIVAGLLAAGSAAAEYPYASWDASKTTDVSVKDSFNKTSSSRYSEDNDVDIRKTISEDNDITRIYKSQEDNDVSISKRSDYSSVYKHSEDNDVTTTVTEDNDVTKSWQQSTDVDFQIATPTLTSHKYQDQKAGHQADTSVLGAARGHSVGVTGGPTVVSAGNDEQVFYGPAMVNNNTNQLPQNNLFVQGSNGGPISQSNTFAGRDMGPKGVFAPVGNTSATVLGDVAQQSAARVDQAGNARNSIADPMSASVRK